MGRGCRGSAWEGNWSEGEAAADGTDQTRGFPWKVPSAGEEGSVCPGRSGAREAPAGAVPHPGEGQRGTRAEAHERQARLHREALGFPGGAQPPGSRRSPAAAAPARPPVRAGPPGLPQGAARRYLLPASILRKSRLSRPWEPGWDPAGARLRPLSEIAALLARHASGRKLPRLPEQWRGRLERVSEKLLPGGAGPCLLPAPASLLRAPRAPPPVSRGPSFWAKRCRLHPRPSPCSRGSQWPPGPPRCKGLLPCSRVRALGVELSRPHPGREAPAPSGTPGLPCRGKRDIPFEGQRWPLI